MLVAIGSAKGSPGATSTALAVAAVWPRPVVLVEADPSGGDLALRCTVQGGGPLVVTPNLLGLAAAVREDRSPGALHAYAQTLGCGVSVIPGVSASGQAAGLSNLWSPIARACRDATVDVIADLGRVDAGSRSLPIAAAAHQLVLVGSPSLEGFLHLRETARELAAASHRGPAGHRLVKPVLTVSDRHANQDCADLNQVLEVAGVNAAPARHLSYDVDALRRLERGEQASGRLGRTLLIRSARALVDQLIPAVAASDSIGEEVTTR